MGNICRSPMAEAVFKNLVHEAGLDKQIEVDSAGTTGYHEGERPHRGTLRVLAQNNIPYDGFARHLTKADFKAFDYVIVMDDENLADVRTMGAPEGKVFRLLDFAPDQPVREVPDPYYNGKFEEVYDLVLEGSRRLLDYIRKDRGI
jgi:protein-tyrosine phosphatase